MSIPGARSNSFLGTTPRSAGLSSEPAVQLPGSGDVPSLDGAVGWLNSEPLTLAGLRGNVVLINFWTYTCINWLRTLPYVRAWAEQYKAQGLVVIGVHTPEFSFEHDLENVRRAVHDMNIHYPVAVDNEYAIWQSFDNHYWPALYFLDAHGHIRQQHFGEGDDERSEQTLRRLLDEAGRAPTGTAPVSVEPHGVEAPADWSNLRSPETYVGYERGERFASHGGAVWDERRVYAAPDRLKLDHWSLAGDWTVEHEAAVSHDALGRIAYRFHARDLHLVMGPAKRGSFVRFRVTIDGEPPGDSHGLDTDEHGNGTVTQQRLYQLVRQPTSVTDREFAIDFLDSGVEAYAFTFG